MKLLYSLPVLAALTLLPLAATAQAVAPLAADVPVAQASTVAPALYADLDRTATFSSSSAPDAPEAAAASAASFAGAAAPAKTDSGSTRPFSSVGVGFKIGLGGVGFDVAVPIAQRFNIRGGAGFFSYNYTGAVNNQNVNASLKLNNAEVMLDYFPFNGSFRLAAGLTVYNNTNLTGSAIIAGNSTIKVGNTTYTSDPAAGQQINANISAKFGSNAVPRFTLGWGNLVPRKKHWSFETELGIEVIGTPTVGWSYGGMGCVGSASSCTAGPYQAVNPTDTAAQNVSLQNDLNGFKVFPIFNIGLSYKIGGSH